MAPKVYAIIPARSGSQGLINKNIKLLNGKPLLSYSIQFAKYLNVDKIICSTDSKLYADIAISFGAEVPFLRSEEASSSIAMEQDILKDLYKKFEHFNIQQPEIIVWLRPTFVFRQIEDVNFCIQLLLENNDYTAARTVCESEGRLYKIESQKLVSDFDDKGLSMIRRQDFGQRFKVFSSDVFRSDISNLGNSFLGNKIGAVVSNKLCGLDIDDSFDFELVQSILLNNKKLINEQINSTYLNF
jgi:CMP-N,N'-diacetyllegionaminic acid synthase